MNFDKILELYEAGLLNLYRTCNHRIDNCPESEVVHDLDGPEEREQRVRRLMRKENGGVR